ncbi:unnamed protein product [Vicia faba]|uniref:Uncharacterized protein n=1 Tax=Vicia faba TaxID=3906 RepID=A0AAV1AHJ5_VICFA|nr:unnamed protein product [Vicia faba]
MLWNKAKKETCGTSISYPPFDRLNVIKLLNPTVKNKASTVIEINKQSNHKIYAALDQQSLGVSPLWNGRFELKSFHIGKFLLAVDLLVSRVSFFDNCAFQHEQVF